MMRLGQISVAALVGLALTAVVILALYVAAGAPMPHGAETVQQVSSPNEEASLDATLTLPPAPHPETIRNVAPEGILPPPVSGPLTRLEARPIERSVVEVPDELAVHRPVVIDAGTLQMERLTIRLAGMDAPDLEETCPSRLGGRWPCGRRARTALRAFVRGRAVVCSNIEEIVPGLVSGICKRQGLDLSDWMIRQGWARAKSDARADLIAASQEARDARKGLWQLAARSDVGQITDDQTSTLHADDLVPTGNSDAEDPPVGAFPQPLADSLEALSEPIEIVETPWFPGTEETEIPLAEPADAVTSADDRDVE